MYNQHTVNHSKPKVGLAVICRCCLGNSCVQCLLQKRGANSSSPHKWSFPGGRLGHPGDLDDDGAVGTRRELDEECGGGTPPGLPPLIHIECCKSGKVKQTLYHVYVVDTSTEKEWEHWQPKPKQHRPTEVDMAADDLIIQGQPFPCVNGYSWVDMSVLIEECYEILSQETDLQHGLVRWVNNYGEHILKTLIARSPKIPHFRRLSNPSYPANGFAVKTSGGYPRAPRLDTSTRRYTGAGMRATLLQPPYMPGQVLRPMFQGSPSSAFYRINPVPLAAPGSEQLSPTDGGAAGQSLLINNVVTGMDTAQGFVVPTQPQQVPTGIMIYQPPTGPQPSSEDPQYPQPSHLPSNESSSSESNRLQFPLISSASHHVNEVTENAFSTTSHVSAPLANSQVPTPLPANLYIPAPLSGQSSKLVSEVSPTAVIAPSGQNLPPSVYQTNQQMTLGSHQLSMLGLRHLPPSAVALPNQEHAFLPVSGAQVPPRYTDNPGGLTAMPLAPVRMADAGPLLPNPPQSIISQMPPPAPPAHMGSNLLGHLKQTGGGTSGLSQLQSNLRKETLCKHYVAGHGQCPYEDKCWFAHPDPIRWGSKVTPMASPRVSSQGSPLHTSPAHNMWLANQNVLMAGMPQFMMASPPQSPLNTGVLTLPNQPRPPYPLMANQQQWPVMFVRPPQWDESQAYGQGSMFPTPPNSTVPPAVSVPQNIVLRFDLLTDLRIHDNNYPVSNISHLASRADHFYVSYGSHILDYKIMFGGNRPSMDRCYLTDKRNVNDIVTCVDCSSQQQAVLVVGTEMGCINICDVRRGVRHGAMTEVCKVFSQVQVPGKPSETITSLVHFTTSIQSAQVVVAGTRGGRLSWYISQPPQKTFSLLYSNDVLHLQKSVIALQIIGGYLVSGDVTGSVVLWSMQSQSPVVDSSIVAHTSSLQGLHVIDNIHFVTIGVGTHIDDPSFGGGLGAPSTPQSSGHVAGEVLPTSRPPGSLDALSSDMSHLSVSNFPPSVVPSAVSNTSTSGSHKYSLALWQFNKPPKRVDLHLEEGIVLATSFHCHSPPGNMFLAVALQGGSIKIFNIPSFTTASELHFPEMKGVTCLHVNLNHSREFPVANPSYARNPFRDLLLTTTWSDGRIMICQVARI